MWGYLPRGFVSRPFDAYTAFALIAVGIYGLIDPYFPEKTSSVINEIFFHVIEVYFIVASVLLVFALLANPKKHPVFAYFGQMYAWAFIAAAGIALMTFQLWHNISYGVTMDGGILYWLLFFVFGCVGWAAFFRSVDMYITLKKMNKDVVLWTQD
jgi:drug/metabolite transporter (DMT)-like permease